MTNPPEWNPGQQPSYLPPSGGHTDPALAPPPPPISTGWQGSYQGGAGYQGGSYPGSGTYQDGGSYPSGYPGYQAPGAYPGPAGYQTPYQPTLQSRDAQSAETLAIVSLVFSLLGLTNGVTAIIGVVCGHIALSKMKRSGSDRGRGMALAGTIVGWVIVGGGLAVLLLWLIILAAVAAA